MSYLITTRVLDRFDWRIDNFYIKNNSKHVVVDIHQNELLLLEGFVYDLNSKTRLDVAELKILINKSKIENADFPKNITGQYNIIHIKDNQIYIVSDFISMKPLYYHFGHEIFISNNIYTFLEYNFEIDSIALFQSMIPPLSTPLNSRTLVKSVLSLRGGEYLSYDCETKLSNLIIDSMDMNNQSINDDEVVQIIEMLKNNADIYSDIFKKIVLPISGGVDSRITLSSFKKTDANFQLLSYGEEDYIDNKIAKKLAEFAGFSHFNVSFKNHLFPTVEEYESLIKNGGQFFVGAWFSVLRALKKNKIYNDNVVILGDVLDTLRAKNIKSLRSRTKRIKYQLKKIIGKDLELEELNVNEFASAQKMIYKNKVLQLKDANPKFFKKLGYSHTQFMSETERDIDLFLEYIVKKFNPKNQVNLEEAFYVSTWGAKTMSKQINVFEGDFQSYVLMSSRHVVKFNLNFSPLDRFEDKLTHLLLRQKSFNLYSHFATSQIPFIAYNSNIYLKYIVWAFRSGIDQILIKSSRARLVKNIEWKEYYKNENNKKLLSKLLQNVDQDLKDVPIKIFDDRASGKLWPLSETDINTYIYLLKINNLK